jgi:hypothetical protein
MKTHLIFAWLLLAGPAAAQELRGGAAVIDITPPIGYPMWGYASRKDAPSRGVLDPLQARVLVLETGGTRVAFVSLDLGRAPTRAVMERIRKQAKTDARIDSLFLVGSHTHHGPVIELDGWPTAKDSYVRQLEHKLVEAMKRAAAELRPARLGVAAKDTGLNRNRHSKRADRPVDPQLLVLRVEDGAGKPIAHAVNFAAHATLADRQSFQFSADFPGVMARQVEKSTGVPCLFLQGAAGDLSPNPRGKGGPDGFGQELAKEVLALLNGLRCGPLQQPEWKTAEDDFAFPSRIDIGNPFIRPFLERAFFPELIDFYEREYREGVRPHLTTALLDGRIGFVGVSGEFFCGHSLSLKRRARLDHVLFLGYCNDYQQYFPTIEGIAEGGYGTEPYIAPAEAGAGERIMDRALIRLYKMRGLVPHLPAEK